MRTLSAPGGHVAPPKVVAGSSQSQRKSLALSAFNGHAETASPTAAATSATHKLTNFQSALKIEELTAAATTTAGDAATATTATTMDDLKSRRQRQFSSELETASMPILMPKRVGINLATVATSPSPSPSLTLTSRNVITPPPAAKTAAVTVAATGGVQQSSGKGGATPGYLVDVTKKGSTSTIWTSEESILRSVGAVDEDNK